MSLNSCIEQVAIGMNDRDWEKMKQGSH